MSADLHGLLAPEESLIWKDRRPVHVSKFSNILSLDITRPLIQLSCIEIL